MTSPNQGLPVDLSKLIGLGAFQIGGGADGFNFGETITQDAAKLIYQGLAFNPADALGSLEAALQRLPLEALQAMQPFLPGTLITDFTDVLKAVESIINTLNPIPVFLGLETWEDWLSGVFGLFSSEFDQIIGILNGSLITPINNEIQGVKDWFSGLMNTTIPGLGTAVNAINDFVNGIVAALVSALRGIPFVGGTIADTLAALTGAVTNKQSQQQNFTISALASTTRKPIYVSPYPVSDVTYMDGLNVTLVTVGATGAVSSGTGVAAHTHVLDSNDGFVNPAGRIIQQGWAQGGYITITDTTVFDTVACKVAKEATALNNVFLEVLRENDAGGSDLISSNEISSMITTTAFTKVEATLTSPIVVQAGERYLVRVRNSSTVNTNVLIISVGEGTSSINAAWLTTTSALSVLTSYTASQTATALVNGTYLPWMMLAAKNPVEPELSFSDDFNRQFLGPDWSSPDGLTVAGNQLSYGGTANGEQTGFYIRRTTSDAAKVEGNVFVTAGALTRSALRLHVDREGTQSVEISPGPSDCKIYSYINGVKTERASVAVGGTDLYALYYDADADDYIGLKNGEPFGLSWTTPGTTIKHGSRYRFFGARIARLSNINAATIDNFTLSDFAGL